MKRIAMTVALVGALVVALAGVAQGQGQDTCPEGQGWTKVEPLDGLTFTFTVPDGYTVADNCFKAATTLVFGTGETVTNTTVTNKNGELQDLSHASFRLVEDPDEESTTTIDETTTTTTGEPTTTVIEETTTTTEQTPTTVPVLDPPSELPFTGLEDWLLPAGAVLLLAGATALFFAGRREDDVTG